MNVPFINGFIGTPYVDSAHWYITDLIGCMIAYSIVNKANTEKMRIAMMALFAGLSIVLVYAVHRFGTPSAWSVVYGFIGSGRFSIVIAGEAVFYYDRKQYKLALIVESLSVILCIIIFSALYSATMIVAQVLLWLVINEYLKPLSFKPLCRVGEASYSIYVFHQNIGFVIIYYTIKITRKYGVGISIGVMLLMLMLGILIYDKFEKPSRRYTKNFISKFVAGGV